jgi:hypothetical protein
MARCKHGIFLPENPKYKAEDVCAYCKGATSSNSYLSSNIVSAIMADDYSELNDSELNSILTDPEFDHTVKDKITQEIESRIENEAQ